MRVLILNQFFYPDISATSQLMTDLAEDLTRHGVEVTALCCRDRYSGAEELSRNEVYKGTTIIRVTSTKFDRKSIVKRALSYLSFYITALSRLLILPKQDAVIVLTTPPLIALVACIVKLVRGSKVVYLVQDLYPEVAIELGVLSAGGLSARVFEFVSRITFRFSDSIIALGECMARRIKDKGVEAGKIHVIQNWADGGEIVPVDAVSNPFIDKHGLRGKFVVCYSGNMGKAHEFTTILSAARNLSNNSEIVFLFIGEGPKKAEIEKFTAQQKLTNVILLPYAPRNELSYSLGAAGVSVICLADRLQGLVVPSKVYGVMASGRPSIYIGPIDSEAARNITDSACGYAVANGDVAGLQSAILGLWQNPALAERFGRQARQAFETRFARRLITDRYYNLLRELTGSELKLPGGLSKGKVDAGVEANEV